MGKKLMKDDPSKHWFPSLGFAIFITVNHPTNPVYEVQRIDELELLKSDAEAKTVAEKKGYRFFKNTYIVDWFDTVRFI